MTTDFTQLDGVVLTCGFFLPKKQAQTAITISSQIAQLENTDYQLNDTNKPPSI